MAGELGHWRLSDYGPTGYGKEGSFEGFCSGGGIRQLAETLALRERQKGAPVSMGSGPLTARVVAEAAGRGDPLALEALGHVARQLGRGLALLVDLLNPERIVIGSIYARCEGLLRDGMLRTLRRKRFPPRWPPAASCPPPLATASATMPRWPLPWPEPSRPKYQKQGGTRPWLISVTPAPKPCWTLLWIATPFWPRKGGHSRAL